MLNLAERDGELTNTINSIHSVASINESQDQIFSVWNSPANYCLSISCAAIATGSSWLGRV